MQCTDGKYKLRSQILALTGYEMQRLRSHNTSYCLIEVVTKAGLTVILTHYLIINSNVVRRGKLNV